MSNLCLGTSTVHGENTNKLTNSLNHKTCMKKARISELLLLSTVSD